MTAAINNIKTIKIRELLAYFSSPVAYVFIVIFLLLAGILTFMFGGFFELGDANLGRSFFNLHPWLWMVLAPAIGMRVWAEELRLGTLELLLTTPISPWHAILGKFSAAWTVLATALVLTFPVVITVNFLGDPDGGQIFSGYLGSFFVAGAFLAVTCLTSALTRNQVISFVIAVVVCFVLVLCGFSAFTDAFAAFAPNAQWLVDFIAAFGVLPHYENFQRGVIDLRDVFYFLSVIAFCLFCTGVAIHAHRS